MELRTPIAVMVAAMSIAGARAQHWSTSPGHAGGHELRGSVASSIPPAFEAVNEQKGRKVSDADRRFAVEAADRGEAEVELARLALQQAASAEVKQFAARIVDDHGKVNNELADLLQKKEIETDPGLAPEDEALRDRLEKLEDAEFDRAYMDAMVTEHEKDVAAFEREIQSGKDRDLQEWAARTLPMLERHLELARGVQSELGREPVER